MGSKSKYVRTKHRPAPEPCRHGPALTTVQAAEYIDVKVEIDGRGPQFSTALNRDLRYNQDDLGAVLWGEALVKNSAQATEERHQRRSRAPW